MQSILYTTARVVFTIRWLLALCLKPSMALLLLRALSYLLFHLLINFQPHWCSLCFSHSSNSCLLVASALAIFSAGCSRCVLALLAHSVHCSNIVLRTAFPDYCFASSMLCHHPVTLSHHLVCLPELILFIYLLPSLQFRI
jgi:hypothetical protein